MKRFPILHPVTGRVLASLSEQTIRSLNQGGALMPPTPEIVDPRRDHLDTAWAKDPGMAARAPDVIPAQAGRPLAGAPENNRGGSLVIYPGEEAGVIVQTPTNSGEDAEMISVILGQEIVDTDINQPITDEYIVRATMEWGIGGAIFNAKFDWLNGTIISVPASVLKIGAVFEEVLKPQPGGLRLSAALAYGYAGRRSSPARYTQRVLRTGNPDNGRRLNPGDTSDTMAIPPFATSFSLQMRDAGASFEINQYTRSPGMGLPESRFTYNSNSNQANQSETQFPILNGVRYITVRNTSISPTFADLLFCLSF